MIGARFPTTEARLPGGRGRIDVVRRPALLCVPVGNVGLRRSPRLRPPIVSVVPLVRAVMVASVVTVAGMLPVVIHVVLAVPIAIARLIMAACAALAAVHGSRAARTPVLPTAHLVAGAHAAVSHTGPHTVAMAHAAAPLCKREVWSNCQQEQR